MSHFTWIRTALLRATRTRWLWPAVALLGLSAGVAVVVSHNHGQEDTIDFLAPRLREAAEYTREAKGRRAKPHTRAKRLQSPPIYWSDVTLYPSPKEWLDCAVLHALQRMNPEQRSQVQLVRARATSAEVAALASEIKARRARIHFGENARLNAWDMGGAFAHWHALAAEYILNDQHDEAEAVLRNALVVGASVFANAPDRADSIVATLNLVPTGRALTAVRARRFANQVEEGSSAGQSIPRVSDLSEKDRERFLVLCRSGPAVEESSDRPPAN